MKTLIRKSVYLMLLPLFFFINTNCFSQDSHILPEKKVQGATVIRVHKSHGLAPPVLRVRPGHTVIWINESGGLVEIVFTGKQVTLACESPVNFIVDIDGTFISNKIPVGAVASLCMLEKGEFEYRVVWASKPVAGMLPEGAFAGKIIIEKDL